MKSFLQLFLFAVLIVVFYFFYKTYFVENKNIERSIVEKPLEDFKTGQEQIVEKKENSDNIKDNKNKDFEVTILEKIQNN